MSVTAKIAPEQAVKCGLCSTNARGTWVIMAAWRVAEGALAGLFVGVLCALGTILLTAVAALLLAAVAVVLAAAVVVRRRLLRHGHRRRARALGVDAVADALEQDGLLVQLCLHRKYAIQKSASRVRMEQAEAAPFRLAESTMQLGLPACTALISASLSADGCESSLSCARSSSMLPSLPSASSCASRTRSSAAASSPATCCCLTSASADARCARLAPSLLLSARMVSCSCNTTVPACEAALSEQPMFES
jgi:hypothetical protein